MASAYRCVYLRIHPTGKCTLSLSCDSGGQEAALASLTDRDELSRRRTVNREAMAVLDAVLRERGLTPTGRAVANFVFVQVEDAAALNDALLAQGVVVRPLGSFGAPDALRITVGRPEEIAFLAEALDAVAPAFFTRA